MKMYVSLYQEYDMKNQRMICACLLAYAGFLRSEDLLKLRPTDIRFNPVYMNVFIESSRTDIYRDGACILIAHTGTKLCPVVNLERYFAWAKINEDPELYTFYRLTLTNKG